MLAHLWLSQCRKWLRTPPLLPTLTVYPSWGTVIGFFRHVWYLVLCFFPGTFALITLTVPAQVLVVALPQCCRGGGFFPQIRGYPIGTLPDIALLLRTPKLPENTQIQRKLVSFPH